MSVKDKSPFKVLARVTGSCHFSLSTQILQSFLQVKFSLDLHVTADAASRLFIYIGITTFIGRLLSGFLCNMRRVNPIYVLMFGFSLDGSSVVFISQAKNYGHLIAFSFLYGLADGFVIGTFNIIILYCVEKSKRASAFGVSALFYGITVACGPPLAGKCWPFFTS